MQKQEAPKGRNLLKSNLYLYLTEFFAGMSVMAVELGASRLLAPYFSSSQIVWTIIIGTIMIAMALGNLYGGHSADKNPNPDRLYGRILLAAIWIAAVPVVGKYVIIGISGLLIFSINSNFLIAAAFAACMVIFVFPLFLLGTVTPSLVKYAVNNLENSGKTVGRLNAFNTIGSIIGTFVPTFISIPAVGTSVTFLIFAGILLLLAILYFVSTNIPGKRSKKALIGTFLFLLCCVFGHDNSFAFWQKDLTYEGESIYNYLQVYEDEREVVLSTNVLFGVQSVYEKEKELTGMYYDYAMAAPYMAGIKEKDDFRMLILGMGTGTYATQCRRYLGDIQIEGVEIDEKITKLAKAYFALPEDIPVTTYDGRAYLNASDQTYDVIMVDAYQDITIPFQMSSAEFFTLVKEHLTEDGVMVVNMNMRSGEEDSINQYLSDTIASVFDEVYTVDVKSTTNRELFAGNTGANRFASKTGGSDAENEDADAKRFTLDTLAERFAENVKLESDRELVNMMDKVGEHLTKYRAGSDYLTDDRAPVELLGMRVIDDLIQEEVLYYKEVYEKEGLKGLLEP